jgi:hypothetical protein
MNTFQNSSLTNHLRNACRAYTVFFIVFWAGSEIGCSAPRNGRSGAHSDFIIGQWYELRQPAFVFTHNKAVVNRRRSLQDIGFSGTSTDLETFIEKMPTNPRVAGLLMPGDKIKITEIKTEKMFRLGTFTDVWAVVMTGTARGEKVEISSVCKARRPSEFAFRDETYLIPTAEDVRNE